VFPLPLPLVVWAHPLSNVSFLCCLVRFHPFMPRMSRCLSKPSVIWNNRVANA
jgi:hypothetical protein